MKKSSTAQRRRRLVPQVAQLKDEVVRLQQELARTQEAHAEDEGRCRQVRLELMKVIDEGRRCQQQLELEREERRASEVELQRRFCRLQLDHVSLEEVNRQNFDKRYRNGEVAAVMAFLLVDSDTSVIDAMIKITEACHQMDVPEDVLTDSRRTLQRAFSARIDQTMDQVLLASQPPVDDNDDSTVH